uniref:Uncharacterized protein n=1 Tax=Anguilla anguilla TaxID=7936 RepID=A0A0E9XIZ3_ANGAN
MVLLISSPHTVDLISHFPSASRT